MSSSLGRALPDEGYSEHPLTVFNPFKSEGMPSWLIAMTPADRASKE